MKTGFRGAFVISWTQTNLDGQKAAPIETLRVGMAWGWSGDVVRVDGPCDVLRLDRADGEASIRRRAAKSVRRLVGAAVHDRADVEAVKVDDPLMDSYFVVTDGIQSYTVTVIEVGPGARPLLMFVDELPPRNRDLWVVHHAIGERPRGPGDASNGGVICFTPGTRIATPGGDRAIETLREGDMIRTRDNGTRQIKWIGSRRMTGARLYAIPALRPIRIRAGALGIERPDQELLVSPEHRMLVRGAAARALFNTPEVLVPAGRLINGDTVFVDMAVRQVTYVHLLLDAHQIVWANGVETESFHPASAALSALDPADRTRLLAQFPGLERDPHLYGSYARRSLSGPEAAILMHEAA